MALTDNLVSYWKCDEASGTRDDAHSTHDLTDNNTVGAATGIINDAADFDGSDYLSNNDSEVKPTGDFSLSLWTRGDSFGSSNQWLFHQLDGSLFGPLGYINTSGNLIYGQLLDQRTAGLGLGNSTWYHIVITVSSTTWLVYLNGSLNDTETSLSYTASSGALKFGVGSDLGVSGLDGREDEIGLWIGRALSSTEVTSLYNGGAGLAYPLSSFTPTDFTANLTQASPFARRRRQTVPYGSPLAPQLSLADIRRYGKAA